MKNICYASVMVQSSKLFCKESTTLHTFTPTYLKSLNIPIGLWTQPPSANHVNTLANFVLHNTLFRQLTQLHCLETYRSLFRAFLSSCSDLLLSSECRRSAGTPNCIQKN